MSKTKTSFLDAVLSGVFTVPGDGCVDYPPIMQLLKAQDYHGWLVVEAEQDPGDCPSADLCPSGV